MKNVKHDKKVRDRSTKASTRRQDRISASIRETASPAAQTRLRPSRERDLKGHAGDPVAPPPRAIERSEVHGVSGKRKLRPR